MAEVSLLTEKLHRFGVVGAGVIPDSLTTLRLAQAREKLDEASLPGPAGIGTSDADAALPTPSGPPVAAKPKEIIPVQSPGDLSRQQILDILAETVRVQTIVQQEVSVLARKLAKEKSEKKKKRQALNFLDGHKKILELNLPREPLEDYGLTEAAFQKHLQTYQEDEEVMACADKLLHPNGKGNSKDAAGITVDKVIEIHQFMVLEMQKVLQEFLSLPQEVRRSFTGKGCETTAELLVSIAVEQQIGLRCEDVEQAVVMYEEVLGGCPEFARCTEQLAQMMQHLIGASQPRVEKSEFVQILRHMGEGAQKARKFAKKLFEDYRSKSCDIATAYSRFEQFSEAVAGEAEALPELSPVEMQLCYDEYRNDPEVLAAWAQSGAENNVMMQAMMVPPSPNGGSREPTRIEDKKGKKLKASEIIEMQELMVDELKRTTEAAAAALADGAGPWKAEVALQMVQSLASAAVERRYGVSSEEMTMAGFQHVQALQKNERFVRATEKQQEILMRVPQLCGVTE